jgi:uncharacterized protein (TIGR02231 family)
LVKELKMTELKTAISAVAAYPDRARITRTGALTLEPGSYRLEVAELPLAIDTASVRAKAEGTARARLLGVDVQRRFYEETPTERVRELEKQIEQLRDEMVALDAQVALLKGEGEALQKLATSAETFAKGLAFGKTTSADQMALFDELRERLARIDESLRALVIQRRDLERRLEKLENELSQLRGARGRERYVAIIEVEVSAPGDLTVELTYLVGRAGWVPLYDLRLVEEGTERSLQVTYLAQVTQRTGEDWGQVALTLSTARPALAETLPELDPWMIGPLPAPKPRAVRRKMMAAPSEPQRLADVTFAAAAELEEAQPVAAEVATATVERSGAAVTYVVPGTVDVPADGTPRKVTVAVFDLTPDLDYVSAPKLVEAAYRRATVVNDSVYTLLPGKVSLFAGDEFIGTTALELTAPQGEIELYLGVDDRVKVKRELKRRDVDKRLLGDRRRIFFAYEIEVQNLLATEAQVTIHDQVPVPRHEGIKVKLDAVQPSPVEQTEMGLLRWAFDLAPGGKQVVRFDFVVEHPRDMVVTGLP